MSGPSSEELHKEVWNALVHCIVSNKGLWDTVDVADVKTRMGPAVAALPWKALTLMPLWQYFKEVGTPDDHARETVLFFASRGLRWGITIDLPPELEALSSAERAVYVDRMRSLGGSSGTFVGRAPVALLATAPPPPAAEPRAPLSSAAPPRQRTGAVTPPPPWPHRQAAAAAARIAVIAVAGLFLVNAVRGGGEIDPHPYQVALGDLCSAVVVHGKAVMCTAAPAAFLDPTTTAIRVEAVRIAMNATVLFMDNDGEAVDPLARPPESALPEQPAGDAPSGA